MKLTGIIWLREIVDKLAFKHHVETHEVEEVLSNRPKIRVVEKANAKVKMCIWRWDEPTRVDIWRFFLSTRELARR